MLVVHCPHWPISARGHEPSEPVVVIAKEHVVAASPAAQQWGVFVGQRRRDARSLCPDLIVHRADPGLDERAFEAVLKSVRRFTAACVKGDGWLAFATRGPARYFGGEVALSHAVADALDGALDLPARAQRFDGGFSLIGTWWRIGIADGIFGAQQAAREGRIIKKGTTPTFLAGLAVDRLEMPELTDVLSRLGIRTLGQFAELDEGDVLARFGQIGAGAYRRAGGLSGEPIFFSATTPDEHRVEMRFDEPIIQLDGVAFVGKVLADELSGHLESKGLSCSVLEVSFEMADGEMSAAVWNRERSWSASMIAERLRYQLGVWIEQHQRDLHAEEDDIGGLVAVGLHALEVAPMRAKAEPLWGSSSHEDEQTSKVLARLQGMLGEDAVQRAVLRGGRGPRERVQLLSFEASREVSKDVEQAPWPGQLPSPSPAVVPRFPEQVHLFDDQGEELRVDARGMLSAPPTTLVVGERPSVLVVSWAGPWPVDEWWWDREEHRRRARLQVISAAGEGLLLMLEKGRWFVEGIYD